MARWDMILYDLMNRYDRDSTAKEIKEIEGWAIR
jgi:hypothetical protein